MKTKQKQITPLKKQTNLPSNFFGILLTGIVFISCHNPYDGTFEVIKYYKSDEKWPCFIKKENKQFLVIEYKRKYVNGELVKYEGCASEGLFTIDFEKYTNYLAEDERVKKLSIKRNKNNVTFFGITYPILKKINDSVFVKSKNKNEFYVFIGKIPH